MGIEIRGLGKVFPRGTRALRGIDLDVNDGELTVLVGPSGSGKTTLLRLVAGLEEPSGGSIRLNGNDLNDVPPHQRNLALVFQNLALYSHLTVADNLAFGLKLGPKAEDSAGKNRVAEVATMLGIGHLLDRYPAELSGGEQQRVALGRAIVRRPEALLLDEPLSSLDAPIRRKLRRELKQVQRQLGVPTIYVTHDQAEALALGDRIAVLDQGALQQVGTPDEIYNRPASRFVAEFFGPQGMNFIAGQLKQAGERTRFEASGIAVDLPAAETTRLPAGDALWGFRPEDVHCIPGGPLRGKIKSTESFGSSTYAQIQIANSTVQPEAIVVTVQLDSNGSSPKTGNEVTLAIDFQHVHWFDPITGKRLNLELEA